MKRLGFIFGILITGTIFAQNDVTYPLLNETQNALLDRYGIDYTGIYTRYAIETQTHLNLITEEQIKANTAYQKFQSWNAYYHLKSIPDINNFSSNMQTYFETKLLRDDWMRLFLNDTKIIQQVTIQINDVENNVKTIDILETRDVRSAYGGLRILIFVQDYTDTWTMIFEDLTLDCPQCPVW
jgi:hypothetical protein